MRFYPYPSNSAYSVMEVRQETAKQEKDIMQEAERLGKQMEINTDDEEARRCAECFECFGP